jgi:hypothetical protein
VTNDHNPGLHWGDAHEIAPGHSVLIVLEDCGHPECMRSMADGLFEWARRGDFNIAVLSQPATVSVLTPEEREMLDSNPDIDWGPDDPRKN